MPDSIELSGLPEDIREDMVYITILKQIVDKIWPRMMKGLDGIVEKAYILDEWTFSAIGHIGILD